MGLETRKFNSSNTAGASPLKIPFLIGFDLYIVLLVLVPLGVCTQRRPSGMDGLQRRAEHYSSIFYNTQRTTITVSRKLVLPGL